MNERTKRCLGCASNNLLPVFDLGLPYLNDFVESEDAQKCERFPLALVFCDHCALGQLACHLPQDASFRKYWYRSSITKTMNEHLREIAEIVEDMAELKAGHRVLDIGANDGTLLRCYPACVDRRGFEPARNLNELAREGGNRIICDYFKANPTSERFHAITAISMFYDVPNPLEFLRDIADSLTPCGLFVVQMNYAKMMVEQNAFDNIGHEHLGYYTLTTFTRMMQHVGLYPFKVETNNINGGSFRVYAYRLSENVLQRQRTGKMMNDGSVEALLNEEAKSGILHLQTWRNFTERIDAIKEKVCAIVKAYHAQHKRIWLLGASTRASTFMQYFGIDCRWIQGASERDERKFGLLTSGTWIPIYSEEFARRNADLFIVGPYAFKDELIEREKDFLFNGGEMLFPIPEPIVVSREGERLL